MKIIFCSEPFYPHKPDYYYEKEMEAALEKGFGAELFSFEDLIENNISSALKRIKSLETPEKAIYRGWMLKPEQYETLYNELKKRNLILINSPEEYKFCHYFPESYDVIKNHTPESISISFDEDFDFENLFEELKTFGDKPLILKDYVKSRKHEWFEACFISSALNHQEIEKVVRRFIELQGEDLNEGLVFREFIEFEPLADHSKSGMPLTKEFRLFFLYGELIFTSEYWGEGAYDETDLPKDLFSEIATRVKSNFFTMDVAQKTNGEWLIVELGDAQVAGLPEKSDERNFYKNLKRKL